MSKSTTMTRGVLPAALAATATMLCPPAFADNPIVQTSYTADPAPMVYGGKVYLYTSHDEDVTLNGFFTMNDWQLYSTSDMVNWTDHGAVASYKTFSWGTGDAWAPHAIEKNGKFYLYVPMNNSTGAKIGVAVADNPAGPFQDPLGKALISTGSGNIDPTVFIDDDGQAYMYWGNPDLWYVKLNADMISYSGSPTKVELTTAGFGTRTKTDRPTAYEEGPWFYKRNDIYYLVYPADSTPEKISYTTSTGPTGPWMFGGDIMMKQTGAGSSFTNHPGIIDYKGKSYFFYHNGALPGGGDYKRSVCVEEFAYGADGKIPMIAASTDGPDPVDTLDPFAQVEAETIAFSSGLKTEPCTDTGGGLNVTAISNGDYIKVKNVDFGESVAAFEARVSGASSNAKIELRIDSQNGTPLATCDVSGSAEWTTKSCPVSGLSGKHDLYMKFTGGDGDLFEFNWWKVVGVPNPNAGTGGSGGMSGAPGSGGTSGAPSAAGGVAGTGGAPVGSGGTSMASGGTVATTGGRTGDLGGGGSGGTPAAPLAGSNARGGSAGSVPVPAGGANTKPPADDSGCGFRANSRLSDAPWIATLLLLALGMRRRSARS